MPVTFSVLGCELYNDSDIAITYQVQVQASACDSIQISTDNKILYMLAATHFIQVNNYNIFQNVRGCRDGSAKTHKN